MFEKRIELEALIPIIYSLFIIFSIIFVFSYMFDEAKKSRNIIDDFKNNQNIICKSGIFGREKITINKYDNWKINELDERFTKELKNEVLVVLFNACK